MRGRTQMERTVNTARARLGIRSRGSHAVRDRSRSCAGPDVRPARERRRRPYGRWRWPHGRRWRHFGRRPRGGGAHFGGVQRGFAGAHMPSFGGAHYAALTWPAYHGAAYGAAHYGYPSAHVGYVSGHSGYVAHPGTGYYGGGSAYYQGGHYWGGGYCHGGYWPYCYYRPGWTWYYPVLPIGYATFWWGGMPYYYWNNLYYTWNPGYNGYVVTDPPPTAGSDEAGAAMGDDPSGVTAAPAAPRRRVSQAVRGPICTCTRAMGRATRRRAPTATSVTAGPSTRRALIPRAAAQNGGNAECVPARDGCLPRRARLQRALGRGSLNSAARGRRTPRFFIGPLAPPGRTGLACR